MLALLTIWHGFDIQAIDVEAAITLLAVQHFILILVSFAFDAALAVSALPIVVAYAPHHAVRHLNAARVHCNQKGNNFINIKNIMFFYYLASRLITFASACVTAYEDLGQVSHIAILYALAHAARGQRSRLIF